MAEEDTQEAVAADAPKADAPKVEFSLQRIYLKDLSFEAPQGPEAFRRQWNPKVQQDLGTKVKKLDNDNYDVTLSLTITVKDEEDTMYLVEIQQAGIFLIKGLEDQQLTTVLNTQCPNIIFPYARETVDNIITKGTFPALMLPPINFEAVFQQAIANARQKQQEQASTETVN